MTSLEVIRATAINFRGAVQQCGKQLKAITLQQFPHGSCGDASDLLGMYFKQSLMVECEYVVGWAQGKTHAWLELATVIIDITADQFGNEAVIVSSDSQFHRQFEIDDRRVPDISGVTQPQLQYLQHDYELIVARILQNDGLS